MLQPNTPAPDFELKDQNRKMVKLSDSRGKYVVLYFYPKDLTPGCTVEACSFRDFNSEIENEGAVILGIGEGDQKAKPSFAKKHNLPFSLLYDLSHDVA